MEIWFTSDTHYGHANILKYCNRPFDDIKHHDEELIRRHNEVVLDGDTVYHLGDFALCHPNHAEWVLGQLNGNLRFINGNHDVWKKNKRLRESLWVEWIKDYYELKHKGNRFVLMHYPISSWNASRHGSIHLHGHCHGNHRFSWPKTMDHGKRLDLGVDNTDYSPLHIDEVVDLANDCRDPVINVDHHE